MAMTGLMNGWRVWTGCGLQQRTPSRHQIARYETEESLIPLSSLLVDCQTGLLSSGEACLS